MDLRARALQTAPTSSRPCSTQPCARLPTTRLPRRTSWTLDRALPGTSAHGRRLAPSRAPVLTRAAGGEAGKEPAVDPTSLDAAAFTVERILALARDRNFDDLVRFLPDAVIDAADELRPRAESSVPPSSSSEPASASTSAPAGRAPLTFAHVAAHAADLDACFTFDSFAQRHLYFEPPSSGPRALTRLSAMRTGEDRAVLRYGLRSDSGEEAVLTFTLECGEMLAPQYKSIRIERVWQLLSVTGEPDMDPEDDVPSAPHPSLPPEAVVAAQVAALRLDDPAGVFAFASPSNQAMTGPLERFVTLLRNPMYRPLLRHRRATPHRRAMLDANSYSEVVKVVSDNTGMPNSSVEMVYLWQLTRQKTGDFAHCWMTDSVSLVAARALN
ncbi:hypothetical protein HYH03_011355 [Edaphochlamys debaryana]|uniref:Uncharacterized protein n=1 Tax=Edaphochlamys debaryana TaxID=47281 RepID=A0A835XU93_9CHLO|nr:hypothetical protein HYH03_011355 [Edaphochlamys debaryana]|eukprot:KAG2490231.1 hypothetical protein HYH03_011355 [Edaphochlamys debaryana]